MKYAIAVIGTNWEDFYYYYILNCGKLITVLRAQCRFYYPIPPQPAELQTNDIGNTRLSHGSYLSTTLCKVRYCNYVSQP